MRIRHSLALAVLAAGIGVLVVPAFAQMQDGAAPAPNQGMGNSENNGGMGHGMMSGRGMMSGGCAGMMRSMSGGGRPNSQWRVNPRGNDTPD